jgi:glycosidase
MKPLIFLLIMLLATGCKDIPSENIVYLPELARITSKTIDKAIIYEANIRQYSSEGTFEAFTKNIPELKKLGVNIIWLMPIHPISVKNRKGKLGSPYSVDDFRKTNPDFGTAEDFDSLVETAHANGMYVVIDWITNQTGWNHRWINEHPEYYVRNEKGEILDPSNSKTGESWGWTDVAELNYDNPELRQKMIQEMLYWIRTHQIDGYRLDAPQEVPDDFWDAAFDSIKKVKSDFLFIDIKISDEILQITDLNYDYPAQQLMNGIAIGKKTVADWDFYFAQNKTSRSKKIVINSTSNHNENTWNGTAYERLGDAAETFTVLTYLMPGVPLIYNGQEYDNKKRLPFFDKDSIAHTKGKYFGLYEKLGRFKKNHPALSAHEDVGAYSRIRTSDDQNVLAFWRTNKNDSILFIANLKNLSNKFNLPISGIYKDYFSGKIISITTETTFQFKAWEYKVLIKQ